MKGFGDIITRELDFIGRDMISGDTEEGINKEYDI